MELVRRLVPEVEVADDAYRIGIGRPDGEKRPLRVVREVRAELFVKVAVSPLVEEMEVERREEGGSNYLAHPVLIRSRMPRRGMRTQSGLLLSSYRSS